MAGGPPFLPGFGVWGRWRKVPLARRDRRAARRREALAMRLWSGMARAAKMGVRAKMRAVMAARMATRRTETSFAAGIMGRCVLSCLGVWLANCS